MFARVGLAFLCRDGGSITFVDRGGYIEFFLLSRTSFFQFMDMGIGVNTLLKDCGNCPPDMWNKFTRACSIKKISHDFSEDDVEFRANISVKNNSRKYLNELSKRLNTMYIGLASNNYQGQFTVIVSNSNKNQFTYR